MDFSQTVLPVVLLRYMFFKFWDFGEEKHKFNANKRAICPVKTIGRRLSLAFVLLLEKTKVWKAIYNIFRARLSRCEYHTLPSVRQVAKLFVAGKKFHLLVVKFLIAEQVFFKYFARIFDTFFFRFSQLYPIFVNNWSHSSTFPSSNWLWMDP